MAIVAVLLHTMVQKEGLPSTAEVTKTGGLNLKFDIIIFSVQEVAASGTGYCPSVLG